MGITSDKLTRLPRGQLIDRIKELEYLWRYTLVQLDDAKAENERLRETLHIMELDRAARHNRFSHSTEREANACKECRRQARLKE
jgi:hypothetical protein